MSIQIYRAVRCDFCSDSEFVPPGAAYDDYSTREQAYDIGWGTEWENGNQRDICPDCQTARGERP